MEFSKTDFPWEWRLLSFLIIQAGFYILFLLKRVGQQLCYEETLLDLLQDSQVQEPQEIPRAYYVINRVMFTHIYIYIYMCTWGDHSQCEQLLIPCVTISVIAPGLTYVDMWLCVSVCVCVCGLVWNFHQILWEQGRMAPGYTVGETTVQPWKGFP